MRSLSNRIIAVAITVLAVSAGWVLFAPAADVGTASAAPEDSPSLPGATAANPTQARKTLGRTPFDSGPILPDRQALESARLARMHRLGYPIPQQYIHMTYDELRQRVNISDPYALIQMADRYAAEWDVVQYEQQAFPTEDPADVAQGLMMTAVRTGGWALAHVQVARSIEQGDLATAYAWDTLAREANATPTFAYQRDSALARMTEAERQQGRSRAQELRVQFGLVSAPATPGVSPTLQ